MASAATWSWDNLEDSEPLQSHGEQQEAAPSDGPETPEPEPEPRPQQRRNYPPRLCRICLETVLPTFEPAAEGISARFNPAPRVIYKSDDPEDGRLIRPCRCKGSQKYVHEGCLQAWRHADPLYGKRNYYECPTCRFRYRLQRMAWGHWISSTFAQVFLTLAILFVTVFILGFVADPIINLYMEPIDTIISFPSMGGSGPPLKFVEDDLPATWVLHLTKGLASLGLLGFAKFFFTMPPWHWWNFRQTGIFGGGRARRAGPGGRNRLEDISWTLVILGVIAFLATVWKFTRGWSRAILAKANESVVDVQGDDDDDDDDDEEAERGQEPPANNEATNEATEPATESETAESEPVDSETRKTQ